MTLSFEPGFYWAQWQVADPDTRDGDTLVPSFRWETVEVWINDNADEADYLRVSVTGVEQSQSLGNFVWGARIAQPEAA